VVKALWTLEGRLRIVAQRIHLGDLMGLNVGILFDQDPECRVGRVPIPADLQCKGKRAVPCMSGGFLLCRGERRLGIAALDFDERERAVMKLREGLQLDGPVDRLLGLIEAVDSVPPQRPARRSSEIPRAMRQPRVPLHRRSSHRFRRRQLSSNG
jgi:hypothetical protein